MKHKEPTYIRKRHIIYLADGKTIHQDCKTIGKAKLQSRILQGGDRGCGLVRVDRSEDPKPPKLNFAKLERGRFVRSLTESHHKPKTRPISVEAFVAKYKLDREKR